MILDGFVVYVEFVRKYVEYPLPNSNVALAHGDQNGRSFDSKARVYYAIFKKLIWIAYFLGPLFSEKVMY
jgi:hypothetical protein